MVAVWLLFTLMLFIAEPLFLDRWLARTKDRPEATFGLIERLCWILLAHFDRRRSRQPRVLTIE